MDLKPFSSRCTPVTSFEKRRPATMVVRNRLWALSTSDILWGNVIKNANASSAENNDTNLSNSSTISNSSTSSNSSLNSSSSANSDKMTTAKGVLICRDNSHPFQERTLALDHPVKIGRSVARAKATPTNAIFDCKVLSRNHAILWYDSGKFYLQDTKSSNGTFVNNNRLSSSGQESSAREVCSGDIVQFGVDVVENTKKLTHGCIVATLKLYLPDGKEAKASSSTSAAPVAGITFEGLYMLNQFVQEATRREQTLHYKLSYLKQLVENTQKAANQSWKALIDEDRLLSRVETVESQLVVYSKNFTEDKVRNELVKLQEEKATYQNAAKEALQKILQEKLDVTQRLMQLETRLNETEEECQSLHEVAKHTQGELQELAAKYTEAQQILQETTNKLMESEEKLRKMTDRMEGEHKVLSNELEAHRRCKSVLQNKLTLSKLDSINVHKQVTALRNYMQTLQDAKSKQIEGENFESKDDLNAVETSMTIILNKLILSTKPEDMYSEDTDNNLSWQDDNQVNSEDSDGMKSFGSDNLSYKDQLNDSILDSKKVYDYILPPSSRRTLVNGNSNSDNLDYSLDSDTSFEAIDDICSVTAVKVVEAESDEKPCDGVTNLDEMMRPSDKNGSTPPKLEVRFASDENGKQLETRYEPEESIEAETEEADSGNNSSDSQDSPVSPIRSIVVTVKEEEKEKEEKEEEEDDEVDKTQRSDEEECEGEHLEGDYVKTLKPLSKSDSSQTVQAQEYILQSLIGCLDSLKEEDSLEAQNIVKRELEELKDWLLREPSEIISNKLKELYYRSKNETERMQEVNEELVILKEKYNAFAEEKAELLKNNLTLKSQCGDLLNATYAVPIHYVAPIALAALLWLLFEKLF